MQAGVVSFSGMRHGGRSVIILEHMCMVDCKMSDGIVVV